jgi:hypothetical protein
MNHTHINTVTTEKVASTAVKPANAVRKPVPKVQGQGHFGIKALIISLSLIGTMGGWGALAVNHLRDAQAKQIEDAQVAMLALNDTNGTTPLSVSVSNPSASSGMRNVPTIRVPKTASASNTVRVAPTARLAPKPTQTTANAVPKSPVLVARNDVPARVVASAPVLRDVQAQPRSVRRSRSSR